MRGRGTVCFPHKKTSPGEGVTNLENLRPNASVRGIRPDRLITVVSIQWFGSAALELTYKTPDGKVANELLYRHDEARLELGRVLQAALGRRRGPAPRLACTS